MTNEQRLLGLIVRGVIRWEGQMLVRYKHTNSIYRVRVGDEQERKVFDEGPYCYPDINDAATMGVLWRQFCELAEAKGCTDIHLWSCGMVEWVAVEQGRAKFHSVANLIDAFEAMEGRDG